MTNADITRRLFLDRILGSRPAPPSALAPAPIRPPWSRDPGTFLALCAGCGAGCGDCVAACPQDVLARDAEGRPVLDVSETGCDFCGSCVQACRTGALDDEARTRGAAPWAVTARLGESCLTRSGVVCRTCGDVCPSRAISFTPRVGAVPGPRVDTDACSGCGACVAPCPVGAPTLTQPEPAAPGRQTP
jgi:ferredoxin-type protein NapF